MQEIQEQILEALTVATKRGNDEQRALLEVIINLLSNNELQPLLEALIVAQRKGDNEIIAALQEQLQPIQRMGEIEAVVIKGKQGDKGEDGKTPTKEELLALIEPLIPEPIPGKDGETPTKKELLALIKPLIPAPIPGKDGKDAVLPSKDELREILKPLIPEPIPGPKGNDGSPDTPEQVFEKLKDVQEFKDMFDYEKLSGKPNLAAIGNQKKPQVKLISFENPTDSEDQEVFYTTEDIHLDNLRVRVEGTSPSATIDPYYTPNLGQSGTDILKTATEVTSTSGQAISNFDSPIVPANNWVVMKTTAQSGTVTKLTVSFHYQA